MAWWPPRTWTAQARMSNTARTRATQPERGIQAVPDIGASRGRDFQNGRNGHLVMLALALLALGASRSRPRDVETSVVGGGKSDVTPTSDAAALVPSTGASASSDADATASGWPSFDAERHASRGAVSRECASSQESDEWCSGSLHRPGRTRHAFSTRPGLCCHHCYEAENNRDKSTRAPGTPGEVPSVGHVCQSPLAERDVGASLAQEHA